MKSRALVFDLDDTLIDTKVRHYMIFKDYLQQAGLPVYGFERYLTIRKENHWSNCQMIESLYPDFREGFAAFWTKHVESNHYLRYDEELVNRQLLEEVKAQEDVKFILLSLRSNQSLASQQFSGLSFSYLFDQVFFAPHAAHNPKVEVLKSIKKNYRSLTFLGDAESDASAAWQAGVEFCGVDTGLYELKVPDNYPNINHFLLNIL